MVGIGENACEAVGNTPMIYLNKVTEGCLAKVAVKLEYMNPACSVKDRIAYAMVLEAEKSGKIVPHVSTLIEPTSGNTGIALAQVAAAKGYRLIVVMPETMSIERRILLLALGAEIVLTEGAKGMKEAVTKAKELADRIPNSYITNQFKNPANWRAHYETTGPEIFEQTNGAVDIGVFGVGSGGVVTGVGRYLKERKPDVQIFAVEPEEAAVLSGEKFSVHKIPGMGVGFVPPILDTSLYRNVIRVHSDDAMEMARRLAREEGILAGISSGANVYAAVKLAKDPVNRGKLIVTVLSSFGERYLSSDLYSTTREKAMSMKVETIEEALTRTAFVSY